MSLMRVLSVGAFHLRASTFWLALAWLAACGGRLSEVATEGAGEPAAVPALAAPEAAEATPAPANVPAVPATVRFIDVTAGSGLSWEHNNGAFGQRWLPETMGPGVVLFDANHDERLDVLFVDARNFAGHPGAASPPALFLNQGGLKFQRQAAEANGLTWSAYCFGAAAADYDNDGDPDLYFTCLDRDRLLENEDGRFVDVSARAGLSEESELGASVAFFDADRDGHLDVFATCYAVWTPEKDVFCSFDGATKSYCAPTLYQGLASRYYHNRGDGTFADRTFAVGLADPGAKALGVIPTDLDGDGWIDLVVACDTYRNLLFHNQGDGTFEEIGLQAGVALALNGRAQGGMGVTSGDYDRSGRPSLAITYFAFESTGLYHNEGHRLFREVARNQEIGRNTYTTLGWGCFFFDYDLDGWLDLFIANGDLDGERAKFLDNVSYEQPQQLFRNLGAGAFREVTAVAGGDLARPVVGRGAAYGDLDEDGDLDLVVTTNGGPAKLFENRGQGYGHWLRLSLTGTTSNRDALGTRVEVTAQGSTQTAELHTGGSYLSQSQVDPVFGLGTATRVDEIVVHWPSGRVERLSGVAVDQRLKIVESREQ
ncbi:MAG TPA: CRTAC1 family protein [Thermoanaerobaculia bacterium]|jgi:hypothetical protein